MVVVEARLNSLDLPSLMAEMRVWLDDHDIDTAGFSYGEYIDRATARIAFRMRVQAAAFAARFSGRVVHSTPSAVEIGTPLTKVPALVAIWRPECFRACVRRSQSRKSVVKNVHAGHP